MAATEASILAMKVTITAMTRMLSAIRPPARTPVFESFKGDIPFDLSTQDSARAYIDVSASLQDEWDGDVATFPSFIVSLQMRAAEG